jgi:hypothetical protein
VCIIYVQCVVRHVLITFMPTQFCVNHIIWYTYQDCVAQCVCLQHSCLNNFVFCVIFIMYYTYQCSVFDVLTLCCQTCTYNIHAHTVLCKLHYLLHIPRQFVGCTYSVLSGMYLKTSMLTQFCDLQTLYYFVTNTKAMYWMYV